MYVRMYTCMYMYVCIHVCIQSHSALHPFCQCGSAESEQQDTCAMGSGEAGRSNTLVNEQSGGFWLVFTVHSVKRSYLFRAARELGGSHTADGRLATSKSTLRTRACTHTHSS